MNPSIAIIHYASPPVIGGVEFVIEAQARYLISHKFNVKIITGKGQKFAPELDLALIPEIYSLNERNAEAQEELKKGKTETFLSLKKYLIELTEFLGKYLSTMDKTMQMPSTVDRGKQIAKLINSLEHQADLAMYFGLKYSWKKINKIKGKQKD